jgi:hypothetical protein
MSLWGGKGGSETSDMTSDGLEEKFEGDSADMCRVTGALDGGKEIADLEDLRGAAGGSGIAAVPGLLDSTIESIENRVLAGI